MGCQSAGRSYTVIARYVFTIRYSALRALLTRFCHSYKPRPGLTRHALFAGPSGPIKRARHAQSNLDRPKHGIEGGLTTDTVFQNQRAPRGLPKLSEQRTASRGGRRFSSRMHQPAHDGARPTDLLGGVSRESRGVHHREVPPQAPETLGPHGVERYSTLLAKQPPEHLVNHLSRSDTHVSSPPPTSR